jgi:hypothetical protein
METRSRWSFFRLLSLQTSQTQVGRWLVPHVHINSTMLDKGDELRDRVEARKHELLAKYNELKADTRREAADARYRLTTRLDDLELQLKSGWTKINDDVRAKLSQWLDRDG